MLPSSSSGNTPTNYVWIISVSPTKAVNDAAKLDIIASNDPSLLGEEKSMGTPKPRAFGRRAPRHSFSGQTTDNRPTFTRTMKSTRTNSAKLLSPSDAAANLASIPHISIHVQCAMHILTPPHPQITSILHHPLPLASLRSSFIHRVIMLHEHACHLGSSSLKSWSNEIAMIVHNYQSASRLSLSFYRSLEGALAQPGSHSSPRLSANIFSVLGTTGWHFIPCTTVSLASGPLIHLEGTYQWFIAPGHRMSDVNGCVRIRTFSNHSYRAHIGSTT
ncbi:hypothetical protein BCR34DRAFT_289113 [Clohesyomyces aquaticus]|uniref:Uncharacterized protein n=1 Tax=Clohesyomyces aquaticus TaxID=1231657 RepID=A0A1Y1ZRC9_9PLEO|nr:hypothetical protein BCR34DRAFT_289113 [Clohesyomyces aquaticus]